MAHTQSIAVDVNALISSFSARLAEQITETLVAQAQVDAAHKRIAELEAQQQDNSAPTP